MVMINVNFVADLTQIMRDEVRRAGVPVHQTDSTDDIGYKFAVVQLRRIPVRPRRVHVARDFVAPSWTFSGILEIRRKAEMGEDLGPHQGKVRKDKVRKGTIRKARIEDDLLCDWAVQHFHLGTTADVTGFVGRTHALLFARVTDDDFYMIGLFGHETDWSRQRIVQTIEDNWPRSIAAYRVGNVPEAYTSDEEVAELRKAGISLMAATRGSVYAPLGGGFATDRSSVRAGMISDSWFRWADDQQRELVANVDAVVAQARAKGIEVQPPLEFHLAVRNNDMCVVESNSGLLIRFRDRTTAQPAPDGASRDGV
jgi:hypothetical protein